jgi:glycosyltransferase involved in cell wall biosynthesis
VLVGDHLGAVDSAVARHRGSVVVVSTYPPTACGIATFSQALCDGLATVGLDVSVAAVGRAERLTDQRVIGQIDDRDGRVGVGVLEAFEQADVVIVQHEYGLYAGPDGDSVCELVESISTPTIVVAHTVLAEPTPTQRSVLERLMNAADVVVVMTDAGRTRLVSGFGVDPTDVVVIPHGAAVPPCRQGARAAGPPILLTWGLLGPGKGIEWAIDALALLGDVTPAPRYLIAGNTHPKVAASTGETYREMLTERARRAGLGASVSFDARYRGVEALGRMIARSDVVVLPYDSLDQVTSGVLVDAVAAGRPVIATAFPHAEELLASGAGLVVAQRDPEGLADAIRRVLTEDSLAERMSAEARRLAPSLAWPAVAARYAGLGETLLAARGSVHA